MVESLKVYIAGLGTVGGGVAKLLTDNASLIARRTGRAVEVAGVCDRSKDRLTELGLEHLPWCENALEMAATGKGNVVVELIGGADGIAKEVCARALSSGNHVVTANKAMLAHHGNELFDLAHKNGVSLAYEAAVAGGIPVIKSVREGLAANSMSSVCGIMNGTCNYILTTMRETGRDFADVLAEAQELGYAEADPTFDVDGIDTAHKIVILSALAFGTPVDFTHVSTQGIRDISAADIAFAEELGYRIKLLGIAKKTEKGIEQRVHPCMLPFSNSLSHVEGVENAVVTEGDYVGKTVMQGSGAGEKPTASAVVSDIVDLARGHSFSPLGVPAKDLKALPFVEHDELESSFYVRLSVIDRPGVFADITAILRDEDVSMETLLQRGHMPDKTVPVVMTLHKAAEGAVMRCVKRIGDLDAVIEEPHIIRILPKD